MKDKILRCKQCGKKNKIFEANICRACYEKWLHPKKLEVIILNFVPKTKNNEYLFKLYADYIRTRKYIKHAHLTAARKFAKYLNEHEVEPITSWKQILELKDQMKISERKYPGRNCPIIFIGRVLEKQGKIPFLNDEQASSFKNIFESFDINQRKLIKEFSREKSQTHQKCKSTTKIIRCILHLYKFLGEVDLLRVSKKDLEKFYESKSNDSCGYLLDYRNSFSSFYGWLKEKNLIKELPTDGIKIPNLNRKCLICFETRSISTTDSICYNCKYMRVSEERIKNLALELRVNQYNQYLFDLYLKYIGRFVIKPKHVAVTGLLKNYLAHYEIPTIRNWLQVREFSRDFKVFAGSFKGGCPIEKIARVLQELKVLPSRENDPLVNVQNVLATFDEKTRDTLLRYVRQLKKNKRSLRSCQAICYVIRRFYRFINEKYPENDLFNVNEIHGDKFLNFLDKSDPSGISTIVLKKFYRWAKHEKLCLVNPFEKYFLTKHAPVMEICSPEQRQLIIDYVRSSNADPEKALMLALVLYYGLTKSEIAYSTIEIQSDNTLKIFLFRGELSYKNKEYRRDQILQLFNEPKWFYNLQKRFIVYWLPRYEKAKKSFPNQLMILPKNLRYNRPIRKETLAKRFYEATVAATGEKIPLPVVRRTGGDLHTNFTNATVLHRYGWSRDYSTDFAFRQRKYFYSKKK